MTDEQAASSDEPKAPDGNAGNPVADMVSLASLVHLLIRKGFCTPEELYEEEKKRNPQLDMTVRLKPVQIAEGHDVEGTSGTAKGKRGSWLKRKMSKRRWTRRLGTRLFGWEWKKVKVKHADIVLERVARRLNNPD